MHPPPPPRNNFEFSKEIEVKWDVFLDWDIDIKKDVDVWFDVHLNIEGNSSVLAWDIQDHRAGLPGPVGDVAVVSTAVEGTSSLAQLQIETPVFGVIGQASAVGTHVDTFTELTINLLIPASGGFSFVGTAEAAVEPFQIIYA
jgi:hypothetical protein